MAETIQVLVVILLGCSIVTVIRLWSVLGSARATLANLEETRLEANETLKRLGEVSASTDKIMREEVAPTLQQTRATLENVEITTRALAQTTQTIRRLTGRAESATTAQKMLALGGAVAQNVFANKAANAKQNSAPAATPTGVRFAFALVRGLMARRNKPDNNSSNGRANAKELNGANKIPVLPPAPNENNVLTIGRDA